MNSKSGTPEWRGLSRQFYEPSAKVVAQRLLGHWLIRRTSEGFSGGPIVETEAYLSNDPGCHAFRGIKNRNRTMFGPPGKAYVYLIYGFYHCFNTVCRAEGVGEAVLVRGIEAKFGIEWMRKNRPVAKDTELTSGPGKICVALAMDRTLDGAELCDTRSEVFVAENPDAARLRRKIGPVVTTTRIGLTLAADWPLRFYLAKSAFVSKKIQTR